MAFLPASIISTFLLTLVPLISSQAPQGLTLDPCGLANLPSCQAPRKCIVLRQGVACPKSGFDRCACRPDVLVSCIANTCPDGEICAASISTPGTSILTLPLPSCFSAFVVSSSDALTPVLPSNPTAGSLTMGPCRRNSDCRAPRICVFENPGSNADACVGRFGCMCVPPVLTSCVTNQDCIEGEGCGFEGSDICVDERRATRGHSATILSPTAAADPEKVADLLAKRTPSAQTDGSRKPNTSPESNTSPEDPEAEPITVVFADVCVAEKHLAGVEAVYDGGRHARVLCDSQGSCATAGHVVVFRGAAMMMRSYCARAGCRGEVLKVNSPRWRRGLRVGSMTRGLEFTAFAARYATRAEEVVLAGAVRAGL